MTLLMFDLGVSNVYKMHLCAKGECNLSDIPPSIEGDVSSRLWAEFTVIHDHRAEYFVETPTKAAGDFQLAQQGLNTFGRQ